MDSKRILDLIALVLLIIGALNWGLVGVADMNFVEKFIGVGMVSKAIYAVVGLAGIYALTWLVKKPE